MKRAEGSRPFKRLGPTMINSKHKSLLKHEDDVNHEMVYSCPKDRKDFKVSAKRVLKTDDQTRGASQRESSLNVENVLFRRSLKREHRSDRQKMMLR
jgi:hypothetical protein